MGNIATLPVQTFSSTIGDIGTRIAVKKLRRPELIADATQFALDAYLSLTAKIPFEALQLTSTELPMVQGVNIYDLAAQGIGTLYKIHSIRITYSPGSTPATPAAAVRLRRN